MNDTLKSQFKKAGRRLTEVARKVGDWVNEQTHRGRHDPRRAPDPIAPRRMQNDGMRPDDRVRA